MTVPGFPNFFMLYGPNTNVGSNSVIFMLEAQAHYVVRALKYMRRREKSYVAVRAQAMADFIDKIDEWMDGTVWTTRCNSYFRAANGRVVTQWPRSARDFWSMTRRFRAADYTFEPPTGPARHPRRRAQRGRRVTKNLGRDAAADTTRRLDPALRHLASFRTDLSAGTASRRAGFAERQARRERGGARHVGCGHRRRRRPRR